MKLDEMRTKVQEEMKHIPSGTEAQSRLRAFYWSARMNSLGKKASGATDALGVLRECIEFVKRDRPEFECQYDRGFFEGASSLEGKYLCEIIPKDLDDDHRAVMEVGHQLLKLKFQEGERDIVGIEFEGIPSNQSQHTLLGIINGTESCTAFVRFSRSVHTLDQLTNMLKRYFPRRTVRDVRIDGDSIFHGKQS